MRINKQKWSGVIVVLAVSLSAIAAQADITWNVQFDDVTNGTGIGFDDATFGATRQATFMSVLGYINTAVNENGIGDIRVTNSQTDASGFLASAGPFFSGGPNGFQNGSLFTHATTGIDPFGGISDAVVTFDFGYNWNNDLSAPTGGEFDMFSIALHEMTHGMGFLSLLQSNGNSAITNSDPGVYSVYDSFLDRGVGLASSPLFAAGGDFLGVSADLTSNDLYFTGANALAANGGNPVSVYAPGSFAPGSSISHITSPGAVMQFSFAPGETRRAYTAVEIGILQDIGWKTIPEPSSALLISALFGLAAARRRKR